MPPNLVTADSMARLNKGIATITRLQIKLRAADLEIIQGEDTSGDRIKVRYWLTPTYSIMVCLLWDATEKDYLLCGMASPDLQQVRDMLSMPGPVKLTPIY